MAKAKKKAAKKYKGGPIHKASSVPTRPPGFPKPPRKSSKS